MGGNMPVNCQHGQFSLSIKENITACTWGYYGFYPVPKVNFSTASKLCEGQWCSSIIASCSVSNDDQMILSNDLIFNITIQIMSMLTTLMDCRAKVW